MNKALVQAIVAAGIIGACSVAHAWTLAHATPLNGKPWHHNEWGCFGSGWNQVTNNGGTGCTGYRKWLFDLPWLHNGFNTSVVFKVRGDGVNPTYCAATGNTGDGLSGWTGTGSRTSTTWGDVSTGDVWIPAGGALHADCDIPVTGGVSRAQWWSTPY